MTVRELSERITFREFQEWLEYLEWDEYRRQTKEDFYLAQIAFETRRSYVRHPNKEKFSSFLYQPSDEQAEREDKLKASKKAWLAVMDMPLPTAKKN